MSASLSRVSSVVGVPFQHLGMPRRAPSGVKEVVRRPDWGGIDEGHASVMSKELAGDVILGGWSRTTNYREFPIGAAHRPRAQKIRLWNP